MPYYLITIWLRGSKKPLQGVRESTITDVNRAFRHFEQKAELQYPGTLIRRFDCVMLSRHSVEVAKYLARPKRPPIADK